MKNILFKFSKSKWSKILVCCVIVSVLVSMLTISSSAASLSYDTVSFTFNIAGGNATFSAFHQQVGGNVLLYENGVTSISKLDLNKYSNQVLIYSDNSAYFQIFAFSYFSSILVNGVSYSGSSSYNPGISYVNYSESCSYNFSVPSGVLAGSSRYFYLFEIPAFNLDDFNDYYLSGFRDGVNSSDAQNIWYPQGYDSGYQQGVLDGINSSSSASLGQNLIGDTLSAPFRALNSFQLFTAPNGTVVTLGMVFGGMIALMLLLGFLKMFGGI